jgi:hypothetical protein
MAAGLQIFLVVVKDRGQDDDEIEDVPPISQVRILSQDKAHCDDLNDALSVYYSINVWLHFFKNLVALGFVFMIQVIFATHHDRVHKDN